MKKKRPKKIIGRKDIADFPELNLQDIAIKIDTGAYTSAIHCREIVEKEVDGKKILSFSLLDPSHSQYDKKVYTVENYRKKSVKSSFGSSEKRFVIRTKILLFDRTYSIELSLSERGEMRYPVLIGRKLLMGKFIVDPSKFDLSYKSRSENHQDDSKTQQ